MRYHGDDRIALNKSGKFLHFLVEVRGPYILNVGLSVGQDITAVPGLLGIRIKLDFSFPTILLHLNQLYRA